LEILLTDINQKRLNDDWSKLKGQTKGRWCKLTNDDLLMIAGQREQLVASIGKHYHLAANETERQVAKWEDKIGLSSTGTDSP
jgi:uncharacterized protein YjbJ (UPF0337 family)